MSEYIVDTEPVPVQPMSRKARLQETARSTKRKLTTKDGWLGNFDYKWLCMPVLPWGNNRKHRRPSPFYGLEDNLPILIQLVTGLQHSLAMLGGLIVPPTVFAQYLALGPEIQSYMISAALISSGILSIVQMSRIHLFRGYYIGTGLITVVGASFATLSPAFTLFDKMYANGQCPSTIGPDGVMVKGACPDAYGALLGTMMLCSLWEMGLSFMPARQLKKIFPPVITGTAIILIGTSLIGKSGILNWGGGTNCKGGPEGFFALCPDISAPRPAPWGSPRMAGLGFASFATIILTELFGSPFMRNASIILGLIVGCIIAGATGHMSSKAIDASPGITFLWVHTFKLSLYAPAILPGICVFTILAVEAVGDITSSSEASREPTSGALFDSRVQGGIAADGLAGLTAGLMTCSPVSIFAQNAGVIVLTKCANRSAGYACACFLIFFGIIGKLSGLFLSIPNSVLGGATTFLFSNVVVSGIKVLGNLQWTRKERFTLAVSLAFGMGNILVSDFLTHLFDGVKTDSDSLQGFLDSIEVVISTPYLCAFLVGLVMWTILPEEEDPGINRANEVVNTSLELGNVSPGIDTSVPYKGSSDDTESAEVKGTNTLTRIETAR